MIEQLRKVNVIACVILLFGLQYSCAAFSQGVAPDFSLPSENGKVTLSMYEGKVIYLDFWASWCPPCKESFPWMNEMQEKYQSQGLEVVTINLDANRNDAEKFLLENSTSFTVAFDTEGKTPLQYGIKGMPTSYLIDKKGNIAFQHEGFHSKDKELLEDRIQVLLQFQGE
ncbi:MAG: redoxin domain-containing protein [Methylococcaceae bacterium]|nr:redoxin domain-containing protein [Methylococcaceae bacterium]